MNLWLQPFLDPVFFAPTLGSMLMCLASSLVGVLIFVRRRSLLGEALSHASYPGVVFSILIASCLFSYNEELIAIFVLIGAALSSLAGLYLIDFLKRRIKVYDDAALTFTLASFLGVGILLASYLQQTHALWYRQVQLFLYGQVATMREGHVWLYGVLSLLTILFLSGFYHPLLIINFDRDLARALGFRVKSLETLSFWLFVLAIVIGIRSVGVVLMSGMLIAPPLAARALSHRLPWIFYFSGFFGLLSGYLGNMFTLILGRGDAGGKLIVPTGPMIILIATFFSLTALLLAPKEGLIFRWVRRCYFQIERLKENILKIAWKNGNQTTVAQVRAFFPVTTLVLQFFMYKLQREGWLRQGRRGHYHLTPDGERRARRIVRLHRLWEVYLFDFLGVSSEKVHLSACEMEHILTDELEAKLLAIIGDRTFDPHSQPIPRSTP